MSSFNEIYGDLIKLAKQREFDIITHGCNCKKNMGKGIAKAIKQSFPKALETDIQSSSTLGDISICRDYKECIIVNSYTQINIGSNGFGKDSDFNRYLAIKSCMQKINATFPKKHIGIPLIGCGLAGLKWNKVKKIIVEELKDMDVTIIHFRK